MNLRNGDSTESDWNLQLTKTPDSIGNQKDTEEYAKLSFSNEKVASDNFEAPQSLNVLIVQVNARHSCSAAPKLTERSRI